MSISVVIADDQAMVRTGLRSLLDGETDIDVVGEASDGEQAIASVRRFKPDVALMDIRMPRVDGLAATRALVDGGTATRVLIITTFDLDEYVFEALRAGASGFLLKDSTAEELIGAVRTLAAGEGLLAPAVTRRVIEEFAATREPNPALVRQLEDLSARERDVLELLARGYSNRELAAELFISEATAKTHVRNLLLKLDLRDRVQAVIFAYETGTVSPGTAGAPRARTDGA